MSEAVTAAGLRARVLLAALAGVGSAWLCAAPPLPAVLLALVAAWRTLRPLDRHVVVLWARARALLLVLPLVLGAVLLTPLADARLPGLSTPDGAVLLSSLGTLGLSLLLALPQGALATGGTLVLALGLVAHASAVGPAPLHVLLPLCTLPLLALALQRTQAAEAVGLRAVRAPAPRARPASPAWPAASLLALLLGVLAWLALPPSPEREAARGPQGEGVPGLQAGTGAGAASGEASIGPAADTQDALLGAVDRLQADKRVHWEVRQVAGLEQPTLVLREAVRDTWIDPAGAGTPRWRAGGEPARNWLVPDRITGWVTLGSPVRGRPTRMLEARARVPARLLFLEPEALAFRTEHLRGVGEEQGLEPSLEPLELLASGRVRQAVLPGEVVRMRGQPQVQPAEVPASAGVEGAPAACLAIEARLADVLRELTAQRVAGLAGPAAVARALEAWLQGPGFDYEAMLPSLAPGRRVEDFVTRVRRGNCEWYATALTLALRAHGIPARYVTGYWGGSHTAGSSLWTFYGANYHAWSEAWFAGVGWVPLNPTPPERLAQAADPRTAEAATGAGLLHDGEGFGPSLAAWVRARVRSWVQQARTALGGGGWALLAWLGALGGIAAGVLLGLRHVRSRRGQGEAPRTSPPAPGLAAYHEALALLAAQGLGRRQCETLREHAARAGRSLVPEAAAGLAGLAHAQERACYAGEVPDGDGACRDLEALRAALARPGAGEAGVAQA
ncbi:MAG: transglutaminase domain-containing protein [Planctomycetia bacterium]